MKTASKILVLIDVIMLVGIFMVPSWLSAILGVIGLVLTLLVMFGSNNKKGTTRYTDDRDSQRLADSLIEQAKELKLYTDRLEFFEGNKDYDNYDKLVQELYPKLDDFEDLLQELKGRIPDDVFQNLVNRTIYIRAETDRRRATMMEIKEEKETKELEEKYLAELQPSMNQIKEASETLLQKIDAADLQNKDELKALHETHLNRYQDIVEGYVMMKKNPDDYHDVEDRLSRAQAALEKMVEDLNKMIIQINEGDLRDFDISLRLMEKEGTSLSS